MTTNDELFERAKKVIPGGVNSPVRAFRAVGGTPRFFVEAHGPYVADADGREYVDLVSSWGPALLGHARPEVIDAVVAAARRGLSFGASTPQETELAELIVERVGPVEMVRLVSTGTEATMTAIRLARGVTGRDLLVKFSGHYHGHSDGLLANAGSGLLTLAVPGSAGVPAAVAAQTLVIPYNDRGALERVFAEYPDQIAAVITEAAAANMGVVPPRDGFNTVIADVAHRHGALMISDEVLTGFRVGPAGYWGLENDDAVSYRPDIVTFGKVIGGGLPVAALGGLRSVMEHLAPIGAVYQAGTLSGNPVAVSAGLTTLRLADHDVYRRLDETASTIKSAVTAALTQAGVAHVAQSAGNLFSFFFGEHLTGGVDTYEQVVTQEAYRYSAFFRVMLERGISLPPSAYEAWFVSAAHTDDSMSRIFDALPAAAAAAAAAAEPAAG
jgi:glutamate-1-semialdehyde 2,1-aminomutase